jgi:hypothetical protein
MKTDEPYELRNWTKFPNNILDNLNLFRPTEFMILAYMIRQNLGFEKPNTKFSLTYLQNNTGLDRKTVVKAIKGLLEKGSIIEKQIGARGLKNYEISWNKPLVENFHQWKNSTSTSGKNPPDLVENFHPLKETSKINNIKRNNISFSDNEKKEIIETILPHADKPDSRWFALQKKHLTNIKRNIPDISKDEIIQLLEIAVKGKNNGAFWKNLPTGTTLITEKMIPHLQEYYNKNKDKFEKKYVGKWHIISGDEFAVKQKKQEVPF